MRSNLKGFFILLLVATFLTQVVSAQEKEFGTFTQGQDAHLIETCSNCTYVNITKISLGNRTLITLNTPMTKDGTVFNYTLPGSYTSSLGEYVVNCVGDLDGIATPCQYKFYVNALGVTQTTSQGLGSLGFLILMLVLMFVFGFIGFRLLKTQNWWILGVFLLFFAVLFLIYNTWLGYEYHRVFTGLTDSRMPERIFWIMFLVIIAGVLTCVGLLFLQWKKVLKYIKKEIKKKDSDDAATEDWDFDGKGSGGGFPR